VNLSLADGEISYFVKPLSLADGEISYFVNLSLTDG
jgi:hypothetical protein